jgi:hypothetical protein
MGRRGRVDITESGGVIIPVDDVMDLAGTILQKRQFVSWDDPLQDFRLFCLEISHNYASSVQLAI